MKIIGIFNLKGGVAKSTTTMVLGSLLSQVKNEKILLVDCDPSANLTAFFRQAVERQEQFSPNVQDVLRGNIQPEEAIRSFTYRKGRLKGFTRGKIGYYVDLESPVEGENIIHDNYDPIESVQIDILPGGRTANEVFINDADVFAFGEALSKLDYDHILIDFPPQTLSGITLNALLACEGILVPSEPSDDSVEGLDLILELLDEAKDAGHDIQLCGIFFARAVSNEKLSNKIIEMVKTATGQDGMILNSVIRQSAAARKCRNIGMIPMMADPNSILTRDYLALLNELEGRI